MSALGQAVHTLGILLCRRKQSFINDQFELDALVDFHQVVLVISTELLRNSQSNGP